MTGSNVEHVATLQNETLTASIAQEIEEMEIKTGSRKEAMKANEETRGKEKG